ncbi:MAG: hypothetical protein Q8S73_22470 [Deltaproteobacteria bacterium]|nr:hypothetical protein [Myxococcales bacterium]MDP3216892.1 hypothetical protein [Deltaproteobacteria bacterium]
MARPALRGLLPDLVCLALLGGCAAPARPPTTPRAGADLPPPEVPEEGATVAVAGDHGRAVRRFVEAWRGALDRRDVAGLRALVAPSLGRVQRPGPGLSREAWLTRAEAIFASAARARPSIQAPPQLLPYELCARGCDSALLAPGEWLVRWPDLGYGRVRPGMPSDRVLPSTLRVAVIDGDARVVGVDDELAIALGPAQRVSAAGLP